MKKLTLLALALLPLAAFAAEPTSPAAPQPDYQSIATLLRQQRDSAAQSAQDEALQIALLQQQLRADEAKIAEFTKAATKPAPAKK